jgi:hypothetical protein
MLSPFRVFVIGFYWCEFVFIGGSLSFADDAMAFFKPQIALIDTDFNHAIICENQCNPWFRYWF